MTDAARLAIGWLMRDGLAVDFQAGRFVHAVTTHWDMAGTVDGYMRFTEMSQMLHAWRREIDRRDLAVRQQTD